MKFEWEKIHEHVARAKIFNGWIVAEINVIYECERYENLIFIPDKNHYWGK